jgi:hypothetical protein
MSSTPTTPPMARSSSKPTSVLMIGSHFASAF